MNMKVRITPTVREQVESWFPPATAAIVCRELAAADLPLVNNNGERVHLASIGHPLLGDAVYGMGLSTPASEFQHQTGSVAFDNFRLNSGELACPSWWADAWPDWQALPVQDEQ